MKKGNETKKRGRKAIPTTKLYKELQEAYSFFNEELFNSELPHCLITLQYRSKNAGGHFIPQCFEDADKQATDELAMNPLRFDQPTERTLSVLVHEMVHVWQHHFGTPSKKKRHHNKEWAEKIENIGLCPSSTGKEGGERTGTKMSHYIIPNGAFDKAKDQLLREGFTLTYRYKTQATSPSRSKHKYSCPDCGLNMWGRKEANLVCGNCQVDMEPMG